MHISVNTGREQQGVTELKQNYIIEPNSTIIGMGNFGRVYKTVNVHDKDHIVAIKVLDKQKLQFEIELIIEEVAILNKLDHMNIVKYFETYVDTKYVYCVMEYIDG